MNKKDYIKSPKLSTSFSESGKNVQKRFDNILYNNKGKIGIIFIGIILIVCVSISGLIIFNNENLDEETVNKIIKDSYLDILVNMGNYSMDNMDKEKLLEAGMRIAGELSLVKEGENEEGGYAQYVLETDMNKILSELTGTEMTQPIIIDEYKYYYPYNAQYKCYDIIPMGTDWIHLDSIKSIKKKGNKYLLDCSAKNNFDIYVDYIDSVKIELEYIPDNELVKYKINSITSTKRWWYPQNAKNINFDKIVSADIVEQKAEEYVYEYHNITVSYPAAFELFYSDTEIKIHSVTTDENINIQDKLCWRIEYRTSDLLLGSIIVYYDAYTGEYLGIGMRD